MVCLAKLRNWRNTMPISAPTYIQLVAAAEPEHLIVLDDGKETRVKSLVQWL
jgi:hypothetical protein